NYRNLEIKLGERIALPYENQEIEEFIKNSEATYFIFGIAEDFGVQANFGRPGTKSAWNAGIKNILNLQNNAFLKGKSIAILGHFEFDAFSEEFQRLNLLLSEHRKNIYKFIEQIDKEVSHLVNLICKHNKIPIVIGGGHNNAYGNIKGLALAAGKAVNAVNFDAHTDFRPLEGRHSGNGFSYAYDEGFLKKYHIFGMHENYISKMVYKDIEKVATDITYTTYEDIAIRQEVSFKQAVQNALDHVGEDLFGVELDLDAIPFVQSSALTPSGFSAEKGRQFVHAMASHRNAAYLHVCEGAPALDSENNENLVGKLIAYLVSDFIKAKEATK
ncbi:MAG: formimidoylglutamase, partial [Flavobacterium sp.]|nr:formimidoylglutamase [Candidatus Neoflavobacterium equi]